LGLRGRKQQETGRNYIMRKLNIVITSSFGYDHIRKNWMGDSCGTLVGGGERVQPEFWWGKLRERDNLEDIGLDGKIMLK